MTDIGTQVADFFNAIVAIVTGLLLPATGTTLAPLQVLMWAGLTFTFIPLILGLIKKMASAGGKK